MKGNCKECGCEVKVTVLTIHPKAGVMRCKCNVCFAEVWVKI